MLVAVESHSAPVKMIFVMIVLPAFSLLLFHKKFCISRLFLAFVICSLKYYVILENVLFQATPGALLF